MTREHSFNRQNMNTATKSAPRLAQQAFGYLVVGGLAAVVDIGLFHLLAPRFAGVLAPAVMSFLVAAVVNYSLSSLWVYRRQWASLRSPEYEKDPSGF